MKLLIITQTVDTGDTTLGFFHTWICEFAERFDHVDVICLKEGQHDLPENVHVFSLGKEKKQSKVSYILNLYTYIWQERNQYDAVFVHMNQEYVLLGGLFWKLMGKQVFLWRNHPYGNLATRIAVMFSHKVFCTSVRSFTAQFEKTTIMPAGIDTSLFEKSIGVERKKHSLLMFGRIAPIKHVERAIEAFKLVRETDKQCTLSIIGDVLTKDKEYLEMLKDRVEELGLGRYVYFHKGIPFEQSAEAYQSHEIFLNFTPSGSFDKTVLEALASGMKVVSTNLSMKIVLPIGSYAEDKPQEIADTIQRMFRFDEVQTREYGEEADIIVKSQSLDTLMDILRICIKEKK